MTILGPPDIPIIPPLQAGSLGVYGIYTDTLFIGRSGFGSWGSAAKPLLLRNLHRMMLVCSFIEKCGASWVMSPNTLSVLPQ